MIPFKNLNLKPVSDEEMNEIYEKIQTPYKYGPVMKSDTEWIDSPSVFFYEGRWYMYFISISKKRETSGYETHLAVSDDLLNWEKVSTIFSRDDKNRWDSKQCAGYAAFMDITWGGSNSPKRTNGKYYISYLAGNSDGYEPDPLYMGLACSNSPISSFNRFPEPILKPEDADARPDEQKTLYRSFLFEDEAQITGYKYINVYNGKSPTNGKERIFAAVSNDGENWERYGDKPIIDEVKDCPTHHISGDAQIVKIGDIYVMFFFRLKEGRTSDSFACSRDFVNWTVWHGEPLIKPSEAWDNAHAHKPWMINHNGIVYHFYTACTSDGDRYIAVATSKDLKE